MNADAPAVNALYAAGMWLSAQGRVAHALDVFRALLLAAPGDERSWLGLGACHETLGQHEIALGIYERAALACTSARVHIARARALRATGRDDERCAALDAAEDVLASLDDEDARAILAHERSLP